MVEETYIGLSDETLKAMAQIARKVEMKKTDP
jgi:hypothetical protein